MRLKGDLTWAEIVEVGLTGAGTPYLTDKEVLELLEYIRSSRLIVQSMEAMLRQRDSDLPITEYSMLGLEPESAWGACDDPATLHALVVQKVTASRVLGTGMIFQVWLRDRTM